METLLFLVIAALVNLLVGIIAVACSKKLETNNNKEE